SLGDVEGLAALVRMPCAARAGREVDGADVQLRAATGLDDAVDVDVAGEPLGGALHRWRLGSDLHLVLLAGQRDSWMHPARMAAMTPLSMRRSAAGDEGAVRAEQDRGRVAISSVIPTRWAADCSIICC